MRSLVGGVAFCLSFFVSGCSILAGDQGKCPDTVSDPEGGITEGIDLALPGWLPAGFPVPEGASIRHINDGTPTGTRIMTGFVPGGDSAAVIAGIGEGLRTAGYEFLLAADGFTPVANPTLVALDEGSGVVVWFGAGPHRASVRSGDECPLQDGVLVGMQFEQATPAGARERFDGSSLTFGSARATVGGREFTAAGECLVLDGTYTFSAVTGTQIGLQFDTADGGVPGFASVAGEVVFNLDLDVSGVTPVFSVHASGFSVDGMFIDGLGDQGIVEGHVEAACPW